MGVRMECCKGGFASRAPYSTASAVAGRRPSGGLPARCHVLHASQYSAYAIGSRSFDNHTDGPSGPLVPVRTVCCARLAAEGGKRAGFYVACPAASPTGAGDGSRLHSFISDDSIIACLLDTTRWCRAAIVYQGERRSAKDKHTNGVHNEAKVPLDFPTQRKSFPNTT